MLLHHYEWLINIIEISIHLSMPNMVNVSELLAYTLSQTNSLFGIELRKKFLEDENHQVDTFFEMS